MADENRKLLGLLNGVVRREYYEDRDITLDFLKSELYPDSSDEDFDHLVSKAKGLIKSMASSDMDLNQAETFLTSQTKKRDSGFTENHAKVYLKFWKTHKQRIHDSLVQKTLWSNKLKNMSWRIDVQSKARHTEQMNTPSAIVELQLENRSSQDDKQGVEVVRFEMDDKSMVKMLQGLKDIEEQIKKHSGQET